MRLLRPLYRLGTLWSTAVRTISPGGGLEGVSTLHAGFRLQLLFKVDQLLCPKISLASLDALEMVLKLDPCVNQILCELLRPRIDAGIGSGRHFQQAGPCPK
jgi:hypothetical protein